MAEVSVQVTKSSIVLQQKRHSYLRLTFSYTSNTWSCQWNKRELFITGMADFSWSTRNPPCDQEGGVFNNLWAYSYVCNSSRIQINLKKQSIHPHWDLQKKAKHLWSQKNQNYVYWVTFWQLRWCILVVLR